MSEQKDSAASDGIPLDYEQRRRAMLIAESRGIDLDTAYELVFLRDRVSPSVDEAADASKEYVRGLEDAAKACDDLRANRPTTERGLLIATECAAAVRALISQHQETKKGKPQVNL